MTLADQITQDYKMICQQLENDEDLIKSFKITGEREIEQAFRELNIFEQNNDVDPAITTWLRQEIYKTQDAYNETLGYEQKKLLQKLEDNEQDYRRKLTQMR